MTNAASKCLESIIGAVAQNETSADLTDLPPKIPFPARMVRVYVYFVPFPIRLLLYSPKPAEDEKADNEEATSPNNTSEKSPVASGPTTQPTGNETADDVETCRL